MKQARILAPVFDLVMVWACSPDDTQSQVTCHWKDACIRFAASVVTYLAMNPTLDLLVAQFPGQAYIPMVQAGASIGYKPQTCYNLFHANRFPLPVRKVGAKCMVALTDLAKFMNGELVECQQAPRKVEAPVKTPRRPGRPTKREMIERRAASA